MLPQAPGLLAGPAQDLPTHVHVRAPPEPNLLQTRSLALGAGRTAGRAQASSHRSVLTHSFNKHLLSISTGPRCETRTLRGRGASAALRGRHWRVRQEPRADAGPRGQRGRWGRPATGTRETSQGRLRQSSQSVLRSFVHVHSFTRLLIPRAWSLLAAIHASIVQRTRHPGVTPGPAMSAGTAPTILSVVHSCDDPMSSAAGPAGVASGASRQAACPAASCSPISLSPDAPSSPHCLSLATQHGTRGAAMLTARRPRPGPCRGP